jgi:hypothetical protein
LGRIKRPSDLFKNYFSQVTSSFLVEGSRTGENISSGLAGGSKTPTRRFELASHACGEGSGVSRRESLRKSLTVALLENTMPVGEGGDIGDQLNWPVPAIAVDCREVTQDARRKKRGGKGKECADGKVAKPSGVMDWSM